MEWLTNQGGRILTGSLTLLTAANTYDSQAVSNFFASDSAKAWVTFALSCAAFGYAMLVTPAAPDTLPPPQSGKSS